MEMKWVNYWLTIALASALSVVAWNTEPLLASVSVPYAQSKTLGPRPQTQSAAKIFVTVYDSLVVATLKAAVKENSLSVPVERQGVVAEFTSRRAFDAKMLSLPFPSSVRREVSKIVKWDRRIEMDLRALNAKVKGIVNSDPLNFYLAVAALAKDLGVKTRTWPPVAPAGPTAGD